MHVAHYTACTICTAVHKQVFNSISSNFPGQQRVQCQQVGRLANPIIIVSPSTCIIMIIIGDHMRNRTTWTGFSVPYAALGHYSLKTRAMTAQWLRGLQLCYRSNITLSSLPMHQVYLYSGSLDYKTPAFRDHLLY